MKTLKTLTLTTLLFLAGCVQALNNSYLNSRNISLENKTYSIDKNTLTEKTETDSNEIRFGIVADIHGEKEKAEKIAKQFSQQNLNAILIAGDISRHFNDKKNIPEETEIKNSLIPFLETGKPVYIIAGNHETKKDYFNTINELSKQYNNLFDLATLKYANLKGVNLFGVSGGTLTPGNGFKIKEQIKSIDDAVFSLDNDPVLMVSHMPPKFSHDEAIDCEYDLILLKTGKKITDRHKAEELIYQGQDFKKINFKNSGIKELTDLINEHKISFLVSGHFHMNQGADNFEENIPENEYNKFLFMNPGAAQYNKAAILTIKKHEAKYEFLEIK